MRDSLRLPRIPIYRNNPSWIGTYVRCDHTITMSDTHCIVCIYGPWRLINKARAQTQNERSQKSNLVRKLVENLPPIISPRNCRKYLYLHILGIITYRVIIIQLLTRLVTLALASNCKNIIHPYTTATTKPSILLKLSEQFIHSLNILQDQNI